MAYKIPKASREIYVELLCQAADEIKLRSDEIIGDIDGKTDIKVTINIGYEELFTIDTTSTYISGWKVSRKKDDGYE